MTTSITTTERLNLIKSQFRESLGKSKVEIN